MANSTHIRLIKMLCQLALAALFATAAYFKWTNRVRTEQSLLDFGVSQRFVTFGSRALPLAEIAIAGMLLIPVTVFAGAMASIVLLATFSIAILGQLISGKSFRCGCFGDAGDKPISKATLLRNGVLASLATFLVILDRDQSKISITSLHKFSLSARSKILPIVVLVNSLVLIRLLKQFGDIVISLRGSPPSLVEGSIAPAFELESLSDGVPVNLDLLLGPEQLLLVFASPTCSYCEEVYSLLGNEQTNARIAVVMSGEREQALDAVKGRDLPRVLWDSAGRTMVAYDIPGTPSAIAIDQDGKVKRTVATGLGEIQRMVREL